ncbi:MAG: ribosome biogenesis GTPase Der [Acidobacteria bacterium]|nr:ribosome biogenesis GTPase Der [Acidobacteriota bacterium]MBI3657166.1 ribosome biogenesis GTPase Der [Acidobacteriota bacterium]
MFRVAIIGRPNVGKSTLFNRLCRRRRAIVGDEAGITRDRLYGKADWLGRYFEVIDTGGMIPNPDELIPSRILEQAQTAIQEADALLWVVDARVGVTPLERALVEILRPYQGRTLLVANKVDSDRQEVLAPEFYAFGWDTIFPISAEHGRGIDTVLDEIIRRMPDDGTPTEANPLEIKVAIVGRPNVGKSLLVNRLLGEERVIVSDIPGTTRDAVDSQIVYKEQAYRIVDTAGIRRKGKTDLMAEKLSVIMARKHMEQAKIVLLVMDAAAGIAHADAVIAGYAEKAGASVILALNKWDLIRKDTQTIEAYTRRLRSRMKFLEYAPIVTVSALKGVRVMKLFDFIKQADAGRRIRVPTAELNAFFEKEVKSKVLTANPKRKFEVRYITQVKTDPPTFVLFTTTRDKLHFSTERFIINNIRERYGFYASPIRLLQRTKARK